MILFYAWFLQFNISIPLFVVGLVFLLARGFLFRLYLLCFVREFFFRLISFGVAIQVLLNTKNKYVEEEKVVSIKHTDRLNAIAFFFLRSHFTHINDKTILGSIRSVQSHEWTRMPYELNRPNKKFSLVASFVASNRLNIHFLWHRKFVSCRRWRRLFSFGTLERCRKHAKHECKPFFYSLTSYFSFRYSLLTLSFRFIHILVLCSCRNFDPFNEIKQQPAPTMKYMCAVHTYK